MPEDLRLFLTHAQAQAAIRADLEQYAPQKPLFRDLSSILLGRRTVADANDASGLWLETGMADFSCRLCGRCCRSLDYHDQCTVQDIRRWRRAGRRDLIARARPLNSGGRIHHYRIWTSKDGKHTRQTCPWLRPSGNDRFICSIQDHKPEICRQYPGSFKHARMTGCYGFNWASPITSACTPPSYRKGH